MTQERSIILLDEEPNRILEGRKTQARRAVRLQPKWKFSGNYERIPVTSHVYGLWWVTAGFGLACETRKLENCPYGKPGDRLWVRETWGYPEGLNPGMAAVYISYKAGEKTFHAFPESGEKSIGSGYAKPTKWLSPIFMPRWASRITLEIETVRVEQLKEISYKDARAEGMPLDYSGLYDFDRSQYGGYQANFRRYWDSHHSTFQWESNPLVWVIEFKLEEEHTL